MQALLTYTIALLDQSGKVSDADVQALRDAGYDDAAILDIPLMVGIMTYNNLMNLSTAIENDLPVAP
jgi:alkylhydroperoxidase family enzyme